MRGENALGGDVLSAEEQAILDADRANSASVDNSQPAPAAPPQDAPAAPDAGQQEPAPAADDATDQQNRLVPHAALHEERRIRQETERQLAEERRRLQTLEERTNILLQRMQQPQQQTAPQQPQQPDLPPLPDIAQDPVGHLTGLIARERAERERDRQIMAQLAQAVAGQNQMTEQQRGIQTIQQRAHALELEFAQRTPDYQDAYKHLIDARRRELTAAGWTDPAEIHAMMNQEALALAAQAIQRGRNPAEVVYELAKVRGYQPPAEKTAKPPEQTAAAVSQTPAQQLETIARGQQQARGVAAVAGQTTPEMTATTLAEMSPDEFAAWCAKTPLSRQKAIMGA